MDLLLLCLTVTVVIDGWELFLHTRQLRHLSAMLLLKDSPAWKDYMQLTEISHQEIETSTSYALDRMKFTIITRLIGSIINLLILYCWIQPRIWSIGTKLLPKEYRGNEYLESIAFMVLSTGLSLIIQVPQSLYSDFVIEEKYGFNKKTISLFITDLLKTMVIQVVITSLAQSLIIFAVHWGGPRFYIYATIGAVLISIIMMFIYPTLIAPLFNKYESIRNEELAKKIYELAKAQQFPLSKLYQVDGSKRSAHSNAYMYGFWHAKRLVLYDTLLHFEHDQVLAIIAHEIGHWKHWDTIKHGIMGVINIFMIFFLYGYAAQYKPLFRSFGWNNQEPVIVGIMIFMSIFAPIEHAIQLFQTAMSRRCEYNADTFAHSLGYNKQLRTALIRLAKDNKSAIEPEPLYAMWYYSHPTLVERIKSLDLLHSKTS